MDGESCKEIAHVLPRPPKSGRAAAPIHIALQRNGDDHVGGDSALLFFCFGKHGVHRSSRDYVRIDRDACRLSRLAAIAEVVF